MKPTDILKHEHQAILLVITAAEKEIAFIETTGTMHARTVRETVDFLQNFVDRCHHGKEEKHLFPILNAHGMPWDSGPLSVMLREHEEGRAYVRAMAAEVAGEGDPAAEAIRVVRDRLSDYARLLRAHIDKENNALFSMADRMLTPAEQETLVEAFEKVELEELGEGVHEKYHAWIERLVGE